MNFGAGQKHVYSREMKSAAAPDDDDNRKQDKIISFKRKRDGSKRCPHGLSVSPSRLQAESLARIDFSGVPTCKANPVDVRPGELTLITIEFTNEILVSKQFRVQLQPGSMLEVCPDP